MSNLLLDTTVLVDIERSHGVLDRVVEDDDDVAIAAITVAELRVGVALATGKRRAARQAFVRDVIASIPIVVYDVGVAAEHAELLVAVRRAGRPRGAHDLIIAATARATGRTVVTGDASGFEEMPGVVLRIAGR